jgi:hypothetical protein
MDRDGSAAGRHADLVEAFRQLAPLCVALALAYDGQHVLIPWNVVCDRPRGAAVLDVLTHAGHNLRDTLSGDRG